MVDLSCIMWLSMLQCLCLNMSMCCWYIHALLCFIRISIWWPFFHILKYDHMIALTYLICSYWLHSFYAYLALSWITSIMHRRLLLFIWFTCPWSYHPMLFCFTLCMLTHHDSLISTSHYSPTTSYLGVMINMIYAYHAKLTLLWDTC